MFNLFNVGVVQWEFIIRKISYVLEIETLLTTWVDFKGDASKYNMGPIKAPHGDHICSEICYYGPFNMKHFQTSPLQTLHSFSVPPLPWCCLSAKANAIFFLLLSDSSANSHYLSLLFHRSWKATGWHVVIVDTHHGAHQFCQLFLCLFDVVEV